MSVPGEVQTFRGPVAPADLGTTLIHEHVFVGHPELDLNLPHPEWCEEVAIEMRVHGPGDVRLQVRQATRFRSSEFEAAVDDDPIGIAEAIREFSRRNEDAGHVLQ